MNISLDASKIVRWTVFLAVTIVLIHCAVLFTYFKVDDPNEFDFVRLIDLDYEGNIPTLFSALLFIVNGALLYLVCQSAKQSNQAYAKYWFGLACIFIFLGFDEGTRFHEEIGDLFENLVDAQGWLYFPWVIPYSIAFGIAVLFYLRFYLTLARELQIRLFLCAVIFLSGALGMELLSARVADDEGTSSLRYSVLYTIEEVLEMTGLILLLDTLLKKLSIDNKVMSVSWST